MDQITVSRKELYVLFFSLLLVPLIFFGSGIFVGNVISTPSAKDSSLINDVADSYRIQDGTMNASETLVPLTASVDQSEPTDIVTVEEAITSIDPASDTIAIDSPQIDAVISPVADDISTIAENKQSTPVATDETVKQEAIAPVEQFAAQVGLFSDEERAKRWKNTLDPRFDYAVVPKTGSDNPRFSVIIGPYLSKGEASIMVDRYKLVTNSDAFVVTLHGEAGQMFAGL
ncbi:hypothetical protein BTA51_08980 [Hahella sp. CCB-MM4]|uniref:SPOR domain-containing protein n=1 Tax=Hahella sp. (strain CCB-MM4) TaxID=1926491 RepID=UPI000BD88194|nr:SPOR domain-containing protein [Hahella sp. CCB-MM4]OZG73907.1 hypothetical protein BTA51_08980 [Hahella sp. CCB-MM4]